MMRIQELRPIMLIALVLYDLLLLLISRSWNLAEDKFDGHFLKITSQLKSKSDKGIYLQIGQDNLYVHTCTCSKTSKIPKSL